MKDIKTEEYKMISFENDYNRGAHPKLLERLIETNNVAQTGYGFDEYTESAKEKIKAAVGVEGAEVYLLTGGTQTNAIVISSILRAYEGVIATEAGHINTHEAGAIEATGHKVIALPHVDGKLEAATLKTYLDDFFADANHEHAVIPGMVYISYSTEYGTLYSKSELESLSAVCREYGLPLYLDGARLGYGLAAADDMTLTDIARLCEVFYIGGTKVGALCGEAVVFTKNNMPKNFLTIVKRRGALLAKGRLVGVQFDALFTDGLYFEISRHAMDMARLLKKGLIEKGCQIFIDSPTNQQYIVVDNKKMEELRKKVAFSFWEKYDETHTVIRFVTSWATTKEEVEYLLELL